MPIGNEYSVIIHEGLGHTRDFKGQAGVNVEGCERP